jgi:hypothetical protein
VLLKLLICQIDAELLKTVSFEAFKTINIQDTNQELRFRVLSNRFIDFINQPAKIYEKMRNAYAANKPLLIHQLLVTLLTNRIPKYSIIKMWSQMISLSYHIPLVRVRF